MDSRRHKKAGYPLHMKGIAGATKKPAIPSYEGIAAPQKAGYPLHMKGATDTFSFKPTVITYNEANIGKNNGGTLYLLIF